MDDRPGRPRGNGRVLAPGQGRTLGYEAGAWQPMVLLASGAALAGATLALQAASWELPQRVTR